MAKRFDEFQNVTSSIGDTGIGYRNAISSELSRFASDRRASREAKMMQKQAERGAASLKESDSPNFKERTLAGGLVETFIPAIGKSREAYNKGLRAAYITSADRDAQLELDKIRGTSQDLTDYMESAERFKTSMLEEVDPSSRAFIEDSLNNSIAAHSRAIQKEDIQRGEQVANDELTLAAKTYSEEAARFARNGDAQASAEQLLKQRETLDQMVEAKQLTPSQATDLFNDANRGATEQTYLNGIDSLSPAEALAKIDADEAEVPKGFTVEEWTVLMHKARAVVKTNAISAQGEKAQATMADYMDLNFYQDRKAAGGMDPEEAFRKAEKFRSLGIFDDKKFASEVADINVMADKQAQIMQRISGDDTASIDAKEADAYYANNPDMFQDPASKAYYARRIGMVTPTLKKEILNGIRSEDPAHVIESINLLDRLDESPEIMTDAFNTEQRAFAAQMDTLLDYYTPAEAAKMAMDMTSPTDMARIEGRKQWLKDQETTGEKRRKWYTSKANDALDGVFTSGFDEAVMGPEITRDWKNLYDSMVISGMNPGKAEDKASSLVKKSWSQFNGHYTKFSPEKYYNLGDGANWVKKSLKSEIKKETFAQEVEDFYLLSDDQTAREASIGRPSYIVRYHDGEQWQIKPTRFRPEIDKKKAEVIAKNKKRFDEIKAGIRPETDINQTMAGALRTGGTLPDDGMIRIGDVR